jgi:hypothetical protein
MSTGNECLVSGYMEHIQGFAYFDDVETRIINVTIDESKTLPSTSELCESSITVQRFSTSFHDDIANLYVNRSRSSRWIWNANELSTIDINHSAFDNTFGPALVLGPTDATSHDMIVRINDTQFRSTYFQKAASGALSVTGVTDLLLDHVLFQDGDTLSGIPTCDVFSNISFISVICVFNRSSVNSERYLEDNHNEYHMARQ